MSGLIVIQSDRFQPHLVERRLGWRPHRGDGTVFHLRDEASSRHLGKRDRNQVFRFLPPLLDDIASVAAPGCVFVIDLTRHEGLEDALRRGMGLRPVAAPVGGLCIDRDCLVLRA